MKSEPFQLVETTIEQIHAAYTSGELTARRLVELCLDRIEAYDRRGPQINAIITVNPDALAEADRLDDSLKAGLVGPLHGIPVVLKDQIDAKGMPTTLGSVLFKDFYPDRDAFAVAKLKEAGAIILAKATLGELGGGDTHGSLFGSTRNPYDLERTVGGSSGGPAAAVAANLAAVGIGQEAFASIRRPAGWNGIVGMRPTAGLVSRSGVYDGWPSRTASLGPMTRTVSDLATVLDVLAGYDEEDPKTAYGVGHAPKSYTAYLKEEGLQGARLGVLRESIGNNSEPDSGDFAKVTRVFDRAVEELKSAGAVVVDPVVIPRLKELLAVRWAAPTESEDSFKVYFGRSSTAPYKSRDEMLSAPEYAKVFRRTPAAGGGGEPDPVRHYKSLLARDELMANLLDVMARHRLDAIVHKTVEHQPTLIRDGVNPPFVNMKGVPNLNTFLVHVSSMTVPAGFTTDNLPAGITFLGRAYAEPALIKLAFAYEQATNHRRPPGSTPPLQQEL